MEFTTWPAPGTHDEINTAKIVKNRTTPPNLYVPKQLKTTNIYYLLSKIY